MDDGTTRTESGVEREGNTYKETMWAAQEKKREEKGEREERIYGQKYPKKT